MSKLPKLITCLVKGALRNVGKPFGLDFIGSTVADAWDQWDKNNSLAEKLQELEAIAQQRMDLFIAGLQEEISRLKEEMQIKNLPPDKEDGIINLLAQAPGQVQRTFRRPSDPEGKTAPSDAVLQTAADLNFILPTEMPTFRPGFRPFPNYELVKPLGTGGFSTVWLATELNLKQQHVLKFGFSAEQLREKYGSAVSPNANPLKHEAAIQSRLASEGCKEGIVLPIASHLQTQPSCLVYEYMPEGDLAGFISDLHSGSFSEEAIQNISHNTILQLANYLEKPHKVDVVHRDLKPANILFKKNPTGQLVPMVADFGIGGFAARNKINPNSTLATSTGYQTTMMLSSHSPVYASPQQIRMEEPNPSDDIYSLGVLWYQLLTGDKLSGLLSIPSDWITELQNKSIPSGYIQLIGQCLTPKHEKRIPDAGTLFKLLSSEIDKHDAESVRKRNAEALAIQTEQNRIRMREEQLWNERKKRRAKTRFFAIRTGTYLGLLLIVVSLILGIGYGLSSLYSWIFVSPYKEELVQKVDPDGLACAAINRDFTRVAKVKRVPYAKREAAGEFQGQRSHVVSDRVDKDIALVDVATGKELYKLVSHTEQVSQLAFNPTGSLLASGGGISSDFAIRIWEVSSGKQVHTLAGSTKGIKSILFSPDGTRLGSSCEDATIRIWDVKSGSLISSLMVDKADSCFAFSPDGTQIASSGQILDTNREIKLWDISSGTEIRKFIGHTDVVKAITFSPDGKWLASGGHDTEIRIWDVTKGSQVAELIGDAAGFFMSGNRDSTYSLAFNPEGTKIVSGGGGITFAVWDVKSASKIMRLTSDPSTGKLLTGDFDRSMFVAFSPDGNKIATGGAKGNIRIWKQQK